jgi:dTMP kinase
MDKKGTFIVFEGGEGSGKDTHIERLKALYPQAIFTREPGGTVLGKQIRQILLSKDSVGLADWTELLLFLADRAQHAQEVLKPALSAGKIVISNRFWLSTLAYQIHARKNDECMALFREAKEKILGDLAPDLCLYLDVTPAIGIERAGRRAEGHNRIDAEELAFHERVREGYKKYAPEFNTITINADKPLEEVWSDVQKAVASIL